ncbi:hypothetical protein ZIOFF_067331 [Zingiber officinale]|uniref:Uncharacterized protein n=1 Tax=Zingiber officinale TaxID=94328 RepID=A0A8J5C9V1_ZINOF|nr:hypothetical protein ZIOFF_067331 [Zingiber officinale]
MAHPSLSPTNTTSVKKPKLEHKFSRIADGFTSLQQVTEELTKSGLESSNLIVGIDSQKAMSGQHLHIKVYTFYMELDLQKPYPTRGSDLLTWEFTNLKYSRVEIDEMQFEWAECMLDYI